MAMMNLHDAFMNAALMRTRMHDLPVEKDAERFIMSPRGRFERAWVTFLYVLIEAWRAPGSARPT